MQKFFHLERAPFRDLKVGRKISINWNRNRYVEELLSQEIRFEVPGCEKLSVDILLRDYVDEAGLGFWKRFKSPQGAERHLAQMAVRVLAHQAKLIREFIFEEVRVADFPDKPSRMRGVWLLPSDPAVLERWAESADFKFRAWEVEASGKFHHGDTKYLEPLALGGKIVADNARRYWSQTVSPDFVGGEVLFEGEVTPVRELKIGKTGPSTWENVRKHLGL